MLVSCAFGDPHARVAAVDGPLRAVQHADQWRPERRAEQRIERLAGPKAGRDKVVTHPQLVVAFKRS
jgi:hypothetical protein